VKKRRQTHHAPRNAKGHPPADAPQLPPPTVAVINRQASTGRSGVKVGMRVTVQGTGLYAGQIAVVESISGGVIPAVVIRTEAGRTRRVRTIDLVPAPDATSAVDPAPESPPHVG